MNILQKVGLKLSGVSKDGIYVVKDGSLKKLDSFSWGYEGVVSAETVFVREMLDGKLILDAGPGWEHNA